MKTKLILCGLIFSFLGCVQTDDFDLPAPEQKQVDFEGNLTSISAVKGNFNLLTSEIYSFAGTDTYFQGYVVSSDDGGNFYKQLILQDKPSQPTAGIEILIDDNSLYETYNFGRKLYIKLDGLSLGFNNGVLQLGLQNRGDIVAIPPALIDDHIIRSSETAEVIPLPLEIVNFSQEFTNLYVELEKVQFNRNLVREDQLFSFASNQADQYEGERQLESCFSGATTTLSTSTYADFKSLLLPRGSGKVKGVLTRNYYDDHYVIAVNSPDALDFSGERCDPSFLDCGGNLEAGPEVLLEETFTNATTVTKLANLGWTNVNVNGGAKRFEPGTLNGNRYFRITAYNTTESPLEAWLISPAVNLDETTDEVLSFEIMASYDNATILEVYITEDYSGNPLTTEWKLLDANIPLGPSNRNGSSYKKSNLDISCLNGEIRFAFRYLGSAPDKATTYDIDNIRVTGY
ncbi:MAG: DUF5689 domain-containing protein [Salegentibacter sp.]